MTGEDGTLGATATLTASYDEEADTLYVYLQPSIDPSELTTTVAVALDGVAPGALLELGSDGRLVGIEVLRAAATVPSELVRRLAQPVTAVSCPAPPSERHL